MISIIRGLRYSVLLSCGNRNHASHMMCLSLYRIFIWILQVRTCGLIWNTGANIHLQYTKLAFKMRVYSHRPRLPLSIRLSVHPWKAALPKFLRLWGQLIATVLQLRFIPIHVASAIARAFCPNNIFQLPGPCLLCQVQIFVITGWNSQQVLMECTETE